MRLAALLSLVIPCAALAAPPSRLPSVAEAAGAVNGMMRAVWKEAFLEPAAPVSDEAFLRRLSLDLRGVIPHADEVLAYAKDASPDKAAKWRDWFLDSPDFAEYFAELWEHTLIGRREGADGLDRNGFRDWLRRAFLAKKPYSEIASEVLLAEGLPGEDPAVNFFLRFESRPEDLAGRVSRAFLGTRIECAQCHDHPYADVKREEFWGFAAYYARTKRYQDYDRAGGDSRRYGVRDESSGEIEMPPMKKGEQPQSIPPLLLGQRFTKKPGAEAAAAKPERPQPQAKKPATPEAMAKEMAAKEMAARGRNAGATGKGAKSSRRAELVRWLTDPKNKYFSRALVNRLWAHFLGKGFVNPVDDFSEDSKIVFPELLDYLAKDFVTSGYDLRRLVRIIVATDAYRQQAFKAVPAGAGGEKHDHFASMPIRPLDAEVLARSVLRASGMEEPNPELRGQQVQSYMAEAASLFSRRFGIDETEKRPEFQGTVLQVLLLFNGAFTSAKAPASRPFHPVYEKKYAGSLDVVLHGIPPGGQADHLFLSTLSRRMRPEETEVFERHVAAAQDDAARQRALADVQWALFNSAEFLHRN
jgi:hypothetical protein